MNTEMAQVIENLPHGSQGVSYDVNSKAADDLAKQGAKALAARVLT